MKVLVTGAGALLGQGIIRAIRFFSPSAHIVAVDPDPRAAGLYWADSAHLVPMASAAEYESTIRSLLAAEAPQAVLVGTDVELPFFARARMSLERDFDVSVLVSDPSVIEIADDKWKTYCFLHENGYPCPRSSLSLNESEFTSDVEFPLIVKPRRGARSIGVKLVSTREELEQAFSELEEPIIQECVGSDEDEYTAGAVVFEGRCIGSIVMRRELKDGNTYRAYVQPYPELNTKVRELAERLKPHGPVNFQFRLSHGEVKIFEINARFSGTTPLRARAGFNEVEICLRHILMGESISSSAIQPMVLLRHWEETVVEEWQFQAATAGSLISEASDV